MALKLLTVPCRSDNYGYLFHDPISKQTVSIDVPEVAPLTDAAERAGWTITDIWITHHHHDHIEGVDTLRAATGAKVTGARADDHRLPNLNAAVDPGDRFRFGSHDVDVLDVPGHTVGHIAYVIPDADLAFTGDSLMGLGCGRLFEGTPDQMWDSLTRLAALPDRTLICSGHEYSQANGQFALSIDPNNPDLQARVADIDRLRAEGKPTVPVELGLEKRTNPFLRAGESSLKASLGLGDATDAAVFAYIRKQKDSF